MNTLKFPSLKPRWPQLAALLLVQHIPLAIARFPQLPDVRQCSQNYGRGLSMNKCQEAINNMEEGRGVHEYTFSQADQSLYTDPPEAFLVPLRYYDNDVGRKSCMVTVTLVGGIRGENVLVSRSDVKEMTTTITQPCVERGMGGFITYGLQETIDGIVESSFYEPIHTFMIITISGPDETPDPAGTEQGIRLAIRHGLLVHFNAFRGDPVMQSEIALTIFTLIGHFSPLKDPFSPGVGETSSSQAQAQEAGPVSIPANIDYQCDAKLGKPSTANCETLGYEIDLTGPVDLDPTAGPIIKSVGTCAIAIESPVKTSTTWELLRAMIDTLLVQCISNPLSRRIGGTAVSVAPNGKRKRTASGGTPVAMPLGIKVSLYQQAAFTGPPNETCEWEVLSQHTGDVRNCLD